MCQGAAHLDLPADPCALAQRSKADPDDPEIFQRFATNRLSSEIGKMKKVRHVVTRTHCRTGGEGEKGRREPRKLPREAQEDTESVCM